MNTSAIHNVTGPRFGEWVMASIPGEGDVLDLPNGDTGIVTLVEYRSCDTNAFVQSTRSGSIHHIRVDVPLPARIWTVFAALGPHAAQATARDRVDGTVELSLPSCMLGTVSRDTLTAATGIASAWVVSSRFTLVWKITLEPGVTDELEGPTELAAAPDRLRAALDQLHADLNESGSSNDFCQVVDDWFVEHGWPTILYR